MSKRRWPGPTAQGDGSCECHGVQDGAALPSDPAAHWAGFAQLAGTMETSLDVFDDRHDPPSRPEHTRPERLRIRTCGGVPLRSRSAIAPCGGLDGRDIPVVGQRALEGHGSRISVRIKGARLRTGAAQALSGLVLPNRQEA